MTLIDHFRRMARNNLWSNDRLYRAVLALEPGEFEAERTSFFPSIGETLNHILAVDLLYLDFLEEGALGAAAYDDFVPFADANTLGDAQAATDRRLLKFCQSIDEAALDRQAEALKRIIAETKAACWLPDKPSDGPCPIQ